MEKRLRSALRSSAEDFLSAALSESASKQLKPALKTLIWSIPTSSDLYSSLPLALHRATSRLLDAFRDSLQPKCGEPAGPSPRSPPTKRRKKRSPSPTRKGAGDGALVQLRGLRTCAWIANLCVCHPRKLFSPSELLPCVRALHDSLVLFEMDEALLCEVAGLCEKWWKENLQERETLISQSLPFLLSRSLTRNKKADVHRVYALRDAFNLFDFLDESIEDLRLLLVRCVITPVYMKTEEGRRFTAFTLGLNGQLSKEILALIRSQIPFGKKTVLEAYADILFRAWKSSEGSLRGEIEDGFLQGLIEGAIYASSKSLATSVRRVLGVFLENRAAEGVDKLLFRVAEPILFRSLQVANSNVRKNALHLLIDMFPLEDPDVTRDVKNVLLEKQFFLLERLLVDDAPDVRTVAVEGCCRILHLFWEIIPSSTITRMLTKIVDDLSRDVCNDVKLSTLNGIAYLLGNPQTHEILKVLSPRMGYMFLDPLLSVRLAVCDLLLAIRDIRNFQFNKVVSLDVLLSSLADDHVLVARKITRLLMSSYFPSKIATKEACARFITLIKRSPAAGARFCEFALTEGSTSKSLVELLRVCINLAISPKGLNTSEVDGLFIASANLCHALVSETSCKVALGRLFSKETLKSFLSTATSVRAQNSILSIASIVSPDDLGDFHDDCIKIIINCGSLTGNEEMQMEVRTIHRLMVSSGWFDDLFGALADILQNAAYKLLIKFGVESTNPEMKRRGKLPKKPFQNAGHASRERPSNPLENDYAIGAAAAWQVKDLVSYPETRDAVLKSSHLEPVFSSLSKISWICIEQSVHWELLDMSPILAYTSLCLHTSLRNVDLTVMEDPVSNSSFKAKSTGSLLEGATVEESLSNLLNSAEKHFGYVSIGRFCQSSLKVNQVEKSASNKRPKKKPTREKSSSPHDGVALEDNSLTEKRMSNVVQITTTLLKFIVDAATMRLIPTDNKRWICFASTFVRYVILAMKTNQDDKTSFKNLKENFVCVKSAFSYAAKLLHTIISNCSQPLQMLPEISCLAHVLLDLVASVELHLGSGYASCIIRVVKPWLPDLILGFSCSQLRDTTQVENCPASGSDIRSNCPVWLVLLSKIELCELRELNEDEGGNRHPDAVNFVFKKHIEMMVLLLNRGSSKVLEAAGTMFLTFAKVGLDAGDFDMVLGLVHFICVKLLGDESLAWSELEMLHNCLQESYKWIECAIVDQEHDENEREKLEIARELVSSSIKKHVNS